MVKSTAQSKRQFAKLTGGSLILMAIAGGFSLGYAFPELFTPSSMEHLKDNMLDRLGLYQGMVIGILITLVLDVIVSYGLYVYFKEDHPQISFISGVLRLIYTLVFGVATYYLIQNLVMDELSDQVVYTNFEYFQWIWFMGLLIFGVHIILTGWLMKLHRKIPKILYALTMIAGVAYIVVHLFKLLELDAALVNTLEMVLALPMILGELGLAVWLLMRGGK